MPLNAASALMTTWGTNCIIDWSEPPRARFSFGISLQLHENVPAGALIEAEFENPLDPSEPLRSSAIVKLAERA